MKTILRILLLLCGTLTAAVQNESAQMQEQILQRISGASFEQLPSADIRSFGARADGLKDCKPAFDRAMKQAQKKGGLHLIVPAGVYQINGPIHLVSHVCIELQEDAILRFSEHPADYLPMVETSWEGSPCWNYSPFIYGKDLEHVAIIGRGTIDGNAGNTFATWRTLQRNDSQQLRDQNHRQVPIAERRYGEGHFLRPHLIQLYNCRNITLENVMITNSPFWCVHLLDCNNAICRGLRYDAKLVNNDGIDPESSSDVLIEDVVFNNGDDNVAIKSGRDDDGRGKGRPSENIVIRNCLFKGLHAVVLGSEMSGGIRNVFIENCTVGGYCKRGLYIKTNPDRGAYVHDIYMNACRFDETEDLIYITSMYANEGLDSGHFSDIYNIDVRNVTCRSASQAAIVLQGTAAKPLHDISFEEIQVEHAQVGISMTHTEMIGLKNCNLGGTINSAPSQVSQKDRIFRLSRPKKALQ